MEPVVIDVFSDVVCPWCYLGMKRLWRVAAAEPPGSVQVRLRSFELRPDQPPGVDAMAHLVARYGEERMKAAHARLSAMGELEGIHYDFDRARAPNSFDAHRLIKLAGDRQPEIAQALFRAQFEEGRDVGDRATLLDIAAAAGLDRQEIAAALDSAQGESEVRADEALAERIGVTGVPFYIAAGRVAVAGAQEAEVLKQLIAEGRREASG